MEVYAAFRSVPDYHAPPPALKSIHETLDGAINALYPDNEKFRQAFRKWANSQKDVWEGQTDSGWSRKWRCCHDRS